jgi:hypothetical protein
MFECSYPWASGMGSNPLRARGAVRDEQGRSLPSAANARLMRAPPVTSIAPFTKPQRAIRNKATAHVCTNYVCKLP